MGNCMETSRDKQGDQGRRGVNKFGKEERVKDFLKDENEMSVNKSGGGVRVKVVLTKEELQWLMLQLSNGEGAAGSKRIEEVLGELEKQGRNRPSIAATHDHAWKPSLESIPEFPELLDLDAYLD